VDRTVSPSCDHQTIVFSTILTNSNETLQVDQRVVVEDHRAA